jgi:CubicO group peptidase (beta-lactamase class C family)
METSPDFEGVMTPRAKPDRPGAAVGVRQRGKLLHAAGYGLANVEWGIPIDADTVFRIGSITKQFTAAAIMKLAEAGKLEIDDPIERRLPDYPVGARRITIRHLLNHTSGIKSLTALPNFRTELARQDRALAGVIDVFKDVPHDFEPGEQFLYNNSGYVLLGAIIEAVSGKDYETFLRETFFEPLGLASTRYLHDGPITPRRAAGYQRTPNLANAEPMSMSWPHAAGALGSTVNDLLRWDAALRSGEAVSEASYAAMATPGALNDGSAMTYGFGLRTATYRGRANVGHNGGINGFQTSLTHWPDDDLTVVVLSNVVPFAVDRAAFGLARRALGMPDMQRTPIALDETRLAACAGVYRFEIGPLRLKVENGALTGDWPAPRSRFLPVAEDAFFQERDPEVSLTFTNLSDGAYQQLDIQGYGDPVPGRRIPEPTEQPA